MVYVSRRSNLTVAQRYNVARRRQKLCAIFGYWQSFTGRAYKRTWNNDHFDSVLVTLVLFYYPLYLILLIAAVILLTHNFLFLFLAAALPFTAWAYVQIKPQLDKPGATTSLP